MTGREATVTVCLRIKGRVQGVGYRAWTEQTARRLGLSGWVRNRKDGSVEAVAHGVSSAVQALIAACHEGPTMARVTAVETAPVNGADAIPADFRQLPTEEGE